MRLSALAIPRRTGLGFEPPQLPEPLPLLPRVLQHGHHLLIPRQVGIHNVVVERLSTTGSSSFPLPLRRELFSSKVLQRLSMDAPKRGTKPLPGSLKFVSANSTRDGSSWTSFCNPKPGSPKKTEGWEQSEKTKEQGWRGQQRRKNPNWNRIIATCTEQYHTRLYSALCSTVQYSTVHIQYGTVQCTCCACLDKALHGPALAGVAGEELEVIDEAHHQVLALLLLQVVNHSHVVVGQGPQH